MFMLIVVLLPLNDFQDLQIYGVKNTEARREPNLCVSVTRPSDMLNLPDIVMRNQ